MGGCLQLIISKHQPDLAHAGAVQISPLCVALFLIPWKFLDICWFTTKDEKTMYLKH